MIHNKKINYRKIYETFKGSIPIDENGRSYHVHHIDGNHENNSIENLIAVSIQEHYEIHLSQKDYGACYLIARDLKLQPKEIAILSSAHSRKKVEDGTHHFLGGEIQRKNNKIRVEDGTHNFVGGTLQRKMVSEGRHPFQQKADGTSLATERVLNGTHHLLGASSPNNIKKQCPHCNKIMGLPNYAKSHGNKCKMVNN